MLLLKQILEEITQLRQALAAPESKDSGASSSLPQLLEGTLSNLLAGELPDLGALLPELLSTGAEMLPSLLALL